jgi:hypothetical protein
MAYAKCGKIVNLTMACNVQKTELARTERFIEEESDAPKTRLPLKMDGAQC